MARILLMNPLSPPPTLPPVGLRKIRILCARLFYYMYRILLYRVYATPHTGVPPTEGLRLRHARPGNRIESAGRRVWRRRRVLSSACARRPLG